MIEDYGKAFQRKGDTIYLVGKRDDEMNAEHLRHIESCMGQKLLKSGHFIGNDGLLCALIECCTPNALGFDITSDAEQDDNEFLHGRSAYIAVVSVDGGTEDDFVDYLFNNKVPVTLLGHVTKGELRMDDKSLGFVTDYIKK